MPHEALLRVLITCCLMIEVLTSCLHDAAAESNMQRIKACLRDGHGINERDDASETGDTPLLTAIKAMQRRSVHLLLRSGADHFIADTNGLLPLHVAAQYGFAYACQRLIDEGAFVSQLHTDGLTPLHRAALGGGAGHTDTIRVLVDAGHDPDEPTFAPWALVERHLQPINLTTRAESRAMLQSFLDEPWRRPSPFWRQAREASFSATSQTIVLAMTASGDVSDYTTAVRDEIAASAAARLGVPASDVTVTVLSASVILRIEIATISTASAAIMSTLQASYSSASGAQMLLSGVTSLAITVESAPTTTLSEEQPGSGSGEVGSGAPPDSGSGEIGTETGSGEATSGSGDLVGSAVGSAWGSGAEGYGSGGSTSR